MPDLERVAYAEQRATDTKELVLTKQDEKQRQRRRLQDRAIEVAARNRWSEAVQINRQTIELGEDVDTYNRLGKAYFELGEFAQARDAYGTALRLVPTNTIARKNFERIESLITRAVTPQVSDRSNRELVDLRLFITETGKTALTALVDVQKGPEVEAVVTGEKVDLRVEGRNVMVVDALGNVLGRIEPKLAQRLNELMSGGNRYIAAIVQTDAKHMRVLIREIYQDPSQRGRVSFPGKFSEGAMRGYIATGAYEDIDGDTMDDDDSSDDDTEVEENVFGGGDEEELGLDDIEPDIGDDDDMNEE
ncbi:MAG: tetratricopeptide repeat protein [Roseiflexaceae bacterium]|nr:tetratricopeptide repeat protein [Roseiflexaceae bacterium]